MRLLLFFALTHPLIFLCHNSYPRNGYDPDLSSTSTDLGIYDPIDYLGGATSGFAKSDIFTVGDKSWNQTFIAANTSSWSNIPGDGFLGLAFDSIAEPRTHTLVETAIKQGLLDEPRFGIYYGKEFDTTPDDAGADRGVITIGGSEEEKYVEGDMNWLPVRKDYVDGESKYQLWRSAVRSLTGSRNDESSGAQVASGYYQFETTNAVFDTGAGTFSVPPSSIEAMYRAIGWPSFQSMLKGEFIPLCTDFNSSWSVTLTFEDGPQRYNLSISGDQLGGISGFANREDACYPPFDPSEAEGLFIFGGQFLRKVYSVFDFGGEEVGEYKARVGFGQLKKEYQA